MQPLVLLFQNADAHHRRGELQQAEALYRQVIALCPDHAETMHRLGAIALRRRRVREAVEFNRRAVSLDCSNAKYHLYHGNALFAAGQLNEAISSYGEALRLQPGWAEALNNLGSTYEARGELSRACDYYQQAASAKPQWITARLNHARILASQGRFDQAAREYHGVLASHTDHPVALGELARVYTMTDRADEALRFASRAVAADPKNPRWRLYLGNVLLSCGRFAEASASLREATRLAPDWPEGHHSLATALQALGRLDEAAVVFSRAVELKPGWAMANASLGFALLNQRRLDEALAAFRRAIEIEPDQPQAIAGQARILGLRGDATKAHEILREAVVRHPNEPAIVSGYVTTCRRVGRHEDGIACTEALLASGSISDEDRSGLCMRLSELHNDAGRYDLAFLAARDGNELRLKHGRSFDSLSRPFDEQIGVFQSEALRDLPQASRDASMLVFIVGMPRSGTSLVEQIFATHPKAHGAGERQDIELLGKTLSEHAPAGETYPACLTQLSGDQLDAAADAHIAKIRELAPEAHRISDKTPHNFLHLGLISLLLPGAKIIHCMRHPLDTCVSCYMNEFLATHSYACDLTALGTYYRHYCRLMRHWKKTLDLPILDIAYEDVVADQRGMTARLLDFCGLEWDEACMRFHKNTRLVNSPSYDQVRQPLYAGSVARYRRYGAHLDPLRQALGDELPPD
ncbi:MAG: tetratricopeptide repeat protein [Phycisphaerales bacterium]|nr:tetratricopeptide repeat protein [Phycisphaerales bacterium]